MAYIALYRKFRPRTFDEVVGQEHIEKTLKNQIINNRVGHAYLFSGGRGSGKTSTAKILARAVNCLNPKDGEPCNECEICKQALEGNLVDITEMDAASNNGVDNIRDIREEVEFIPTTAKYRVYIIDEVHMLSTGAFNALLKTLEEPPAHVIFILATTEPQKLPATILSRCQRFDFKRISREDIMKRLKYICEENGTKIEDNALRMISNLADGAMRDAISILDRCVSDGDEVITEEKIRELSGVPQFEYLSKMAEALVTQNPEEVLKISEKLIEEGKDINVFLWELIKLMRDIVIYTIDGSLVSYSAEEKNEISNIVSKANKNVFLTLIGKLSEVQNNLKWSTEPSIMFETGMIKICLENNSSNDLGDSNEKSLMKNKVTVEINGDNKNNAVNVDEKMNNIQSTNDIANNSVTIVKEMSANDLTTKVLTNLKENGKIRVHANLLNTKIEYMADNIVHIIFNGAVDAITKASFQKEETKIAIKEAVVKAMGRDVGVKYDNLK